MMTESALFCRTQQEVHIRVCVCVDVVYKSVLGDETSQGD